MKRSNITQKMVYDMIAVALAIIILVGAILCYGVVVISTRHYIEDTIAYADIAANVIDADRIPEYVETGKKDEHYEDVEIFLRALCKDAELNRAEVFIPYDDHMTYLWDTGNFGEFRDLGGVEVYGEGEKKTIADAFKEASEGSSMALDMKDKGRYICAFSPVYNSLGKPVAVISIMRPYIKTGTILAPFILVIALSILLVSAAVMLINYRLLNRNIIRPIAILTKSAEHMVDNLGREEPVSIDIHTNDELETLAEAFTKMDIDLREYIEELSSVTAERERISGELDAAAKIQKGILPKKGLQYQDMKEFDLAASMTPAREVGGDFYDIFMADDRHLALVIADVSGKGVPASLFMVATKILIKYAIKLGMSPSEAFSTVNEKLLESNDMELFVTAWLALIDLDTGECIEVNAGHEHPAYRRHGGTFELVRYKHSPALATLNGLTFKERSSRLDPGDSVFVYTDGVTEATDSCMELFGNDRLTLALNKNREASPEELLKNVSEAIDSFVAGVPQFDDITMLAFRYNGTE